MSKFKLHDLLGEPAKPGRAITPPGVTLMDLVNATIQTAAADPDAVQLPFEQELEVIPRGPEWFQFIQDDLERCRDKLDAGYSQYESQYLDVIVDRISALQLATLLQAPYVDSFNLSYVALDRFINDLKSRLKRYNLEVSDSLEEFHNAITG